MRYNKTINKIFFGIFIIPLLASCALRPSQLFIFRSFENGQYIYYESDIYNPSKIEKLNIPQCDNDLNPNPIWSPNGKYYSCSFPSPLFVSDISAKTLAELQNNGWLFANWSPDSQYLTIGYDGGDLTRPYFELAMLKHDGTGFTQLVKDSNSQIIPYSYWSPDGKYLAYQAFLNGSDDDYLVIVDLKGKELAQYNLWRLTNGNTKEADGFNWSPDSKKITFLGNFNVNMDNGWYILDLKSGKITNLIFEGALCGADTPGWFPDGEKLLFTAANCPEQLPVNIFDYRIYTINSDGSNLKSLTDASVGNAHWSPDGKFIIFDKYTDQGSEIFIMNADGTNQRNLFGNQSHLSFIQWITP